MGRSFCGRAPFRVCNAFALQKAVHRGSGRIDLVLPAAVFRHRSVLPGIRFFCLFGCAVHRRRAAGRKGENGPPCVIAAERDRLPDEQIFFNYVLKERIYT